MLISLLCLSVFMACKKSHPTLFRCNCPMMGSSAWQWVSIRNGNGLISYPQADSTVVLTLKSGGKYISALNGKAVDSGSFTFPGTDTLKLSPVFKPIGGLNMPDSLYNIQYGADSMYLTSMANSSSGNTKISFVLHFN